MPRVRRRSRLILIALVVVVFVLVSVLLARVYRSVSDERSAITALIQDEARGDKTGMIGLIHGCSASAACRARVAQDATNLRRPTPIAVLELTVSSSFPIFGQTGTARIAWKPAQGLPVTQCVRVRHGGNPITGMTVELLELSAKIKTNGDCPKTF
jgi:hypothetical protein